MRTMLTALLLSAACLTPARAVTHLLPDGGFESNQWKLIRWDYGEGRLEFTDEARSGRKAVRLTGISAEKASINLLAHSPAVDVQAGREYVLSVWHRSDGRATPSVSIFTYSAPWSTAQWKTPQTTYETRHLPASAGWTPWTWRFRAKPGTVQLVVAVRQSGVGEVWFDDVALFEAGDTRLAVVERGTITALPDRRRWRAEVCAGGDGAPWRLSLTEQPGGRRLAVREGAAAREMAEFDCAVPEGARVLFALEDAASGAVLATEAVAAPPLVEFEMLSPRYRNAIHLSHPPQTVRARLACHADAAVRRDMSFAVQSGGRTVRRWRSLKDEQVLEIPLTVPKGAKSVDLTVLLKGVPGRERFSAPLNVVPRAAAGREVFIGDDNETRVDGRPFFPAGFYGPRVGPSFDPIAKAGYTAALTYETDPERCRAWLDDCQRLGLLGMVSVPHPFVAKFDEAKLRAALRVVKQHPALLAWYLFDEPSPSKPHESPADLKRVYDVIADEDPHHPVGVCICVPDHFGTYEACCDMVLPDPYPLVKARRPLTWVSQWVDTARAALGDRKPVWVVPQAFGWDVIENIPDPESYRTPTPAQERCMTYLALTHGARAAMYYCYHVYTGYDAARKKAGGYPYVLGGYLPDRQPALWGALEKLGGEMRSFGPALLRPGAREGVTGSVHWRLTPAGGKNDAWLIAVNADEAAAATVTLPFRNAGRMKIAHGEGTLADTADGVSVTLPPMGTLAATGKPPASARGGWWTRLFFWRKTLTK